MEKEKDLGLSKLIKENESKIKNKFSNYFSQGSDIKINTSNTNTSISSEWLLPKEKISYNNQHQYLSQEEIEIFKVLSNLNLLKNLGSNLIVIGKIIRIQNSEDRKINKIEVRLEQVVSICHGGENLINNEDSFCPYYINYSHKNGPNVDFIHHFKLFYENLFKYNIIGVIKKNEIYDNKLPHFNEDHETNLKENNVITCLIIKNKLNFIHQTENSSEKYKIRRNEFIQFSLKNSIIRKAEQYFISHQNRSLKIPFLIGINYLTNNNKWCENTNREKDNDINYITLKNPSLMNESILNNIMDDLNLNQFQYQSLQEGNGLIFGCYKNNEKTGFSYEKIRKVQNYDWADEYFKKGKDMMEIKNYEKAIDYFKDAEKLDNLNKDVYIQKGLCYLHIDKLENAKKEFKNCLKIEPNDESAVKYLTYIVKKEKQNQVDLYEQMLSKKRKNE